MKINKQFILEVANGKYSDYDMHGEMQRAAQRILDEKVVGKFQTFCFRAYGALDNACDIYDAFTDFAGFSAEIKVTVPRSIHPTGYWQVFGMTAEESLEKLYSDACGNDTFMMLYAELRSKYVARRVYFSLIASPAVMPLIRVISQESKP